MIHALLLCLVMAGVADATARGDDAHPAGRTEFERGVVLAQAEQWPAAAASFEDALALQDRPAVRFNLVLAYHALGAPIPLLRHGYAFLAFGDEPSRAAARLETERLMIEARTKVALLTTHQLPPRRQLMVDGLPPAALPDGLVAVNPGSHRLELHLSDAVERVELTLDAGQMVPWPRTEAARIDAQPSPPAVPVLTSSPRKIPVPEASFRPLAERERALRKAAWGVGTYGALSVAAAAGVYVWLAQRGTTLAHRGAMRAGYGDDADHYLAGQNVVVPFALVGGASMALATLLAPTLPRRIGRPAAWVAVGLGTVLFAVGGALMIRTPDQLHGLGKDMVESTRQGGSLLFSLGLPFAFAGGAVLVRSGPGYVAQ